MNKRALLALASLCLLAFLPSCRRPHPTAPDREAIVRTQQAFHAALEKGDREAVMELLAPDAEILEMGIRETRAEYADQHLPADIDFASAVSTTKGRLVVRQEGDIAWVTASSEANGIFRSRKVDTQNVELMVLAKSGGKWTIRAIHWSGQTRRPGQ